MTGLNQVAALRHDLRTPVNHIVGYAEMLLEDLDAPAHGESRASIQGAIVAAREALATISVVLAPTRESVEPSELSDLYAKLAEPQRRIVAAVRALLGGSHTWPSPTIVEDLGRILEAAERLVPRERMSEAAGVTPAGPVGQARILVVDDEEGNRALLKRRLEREGYAVVCAAGGREALEVVGESGVDLILLDMLMPDMHGQAVLERLKGDAATRDLPVIMISALDDLQAIARTIEAGAEDYLPKPFEPVILRARIAASLAKKRWHDQERDVLRALGHVTAAASAVEADRYQAGMLADIVHRDDAIGRLARVMDRMASQVQEREARLRERLEVLRSEIGSARASVEASADAHGPLLEAGQRVAGRYQIVGALGHGAMGTVYRARDLELTEEVAIKTLRAELLADADSRERFKGEIRLARRITHANVVRTHDFGEWNGTWYLTMELVEGITVRALLDSRGRLGVASTLAIGAQLAQALAVAHEVGVVHRDIKPQNLLLDAGGVLKVMDFGVARLAQRSIETTEAHVVVGTPAYMPPEQITGDPVDSRSDLYSAGAVIYECLTGRLPLAAPNMTGLYVKVLGENPPAPSSIASDVPAALDALVLQLLAKRPDDRVQSAAALLDRLQAIG